MKPPIRIEITETTCDGETLNYTKDMVVLGLKVFRREYNQIIATTARKTTGFDVIPSILQEVSDDEY